MAEVEMAFRYFRCFPDYARTVIPTDGYDVRSVETDAVFSCCRVFDYG